MSRRSRTRSAHYSLRFAGWVVVVVSLVGLVSGTLGMLSAPPAPPGWEGSIGGILFRDLTAVGAVGVLHTAVFLIAGLGLTQAREWARRTLVILLWLMYLWAAALAILWTDILTHYRRDVSYMDPSLQLAAEMAGLTRLSPGELIFLGLMGLILIATIVVPAYLFMRWLNSPHVRRACTPRSLK